MQRPSAVADIRRPLPRGALPFQRLAIPLRQLRRGCVGFLQKSEQELVGVACLTHRVIGENELPEPLVVEGIRRREPGVAVAGLLDTGYWPGRSGSYDDGTLDPSTAFGRSG